MIRQTIYIKNMCCQRCIEAVQSELKSLGLAIKDIRLGEAIFSTQVEIPISLIEKKLKKRGFELITSNEDKLEQDVKIAIIDLIHNSSELNQKIHIPNYLEEKLKRPYQQIHKIFSQQTKTSIEKYLILQKVEKVKELIQESQFSFAEIAFKLGYKSQQHLSAQFKRITGTSMMEYKMMKKKPRIPIDKV